MSVNKQSQGERIQQVRELFDHRENYLDRRQVDIRIRAETVAKLLEGRNYSNLLDIGCGDGSVSVPLMTSESQITLLDISTAMLDLARARLSPELRWRAKFINEDFMEASFETKSFDLVICVGVVAHVADPRKLINKIASVLKPGGMLVLECTDSRHPVGRIARLRNQLVWLVRKPKYKTNVLSSQQVLEMVQNAGLEVSKGFRYCLPLPGTGRFFTSESLYRRIRLSFGDINRSRFQWLGNECIFSITRPLSN